MSTRKPLIILSSTPTKPSVLRRIVVSMAVLGVFGCVISSLGGGGYMLWQWQANQMNVVAVDSKTPKPNTDQTQDKKDGPISPKKSEGGPIKKSASVPIDGIQIPTYFEPNPEITAPRLGDFQTHPWWRKPMSSAQIERIIATIRQATVTNQILQLTSDGTINALCDGDGKPGPEVYAALDGERENTYLYFLPSRVFPRRATSRATAVSLLAQGIDSAYAAEDHFRRTGKGVGTFTDFINGGWRDKGEDFDTSTPLGQELKKKKPVAPGSAIGRP